MPEASKLHHRVKVLQSYTPPVSWLSNIIMKWPTFRVGSSSTSSSTGDGNSEGESTRDMDAVEKLIGNAVRGCQTATLVNFVLYRDGLKSTPQVA